MDKLNIVKINDEEFLSVRYLMEKFAQYAAYGLDHHALSYDDDRYAEYMRCFLEYHAGMGREDLAKEFEQIYKKLRFGI